MFSRPFFLLIMVLLVCSCRQKSADQAREETTRRYTLEHCPQKVGDGLMLDSVDFDAKARTLHYYYSFTDSIPNLSDMREHILSARATVLQEICNSVELINEKREGLTLSYTYFSHTPKREIATLSFSSKDYQGQSRKKTRHLPAK